MADIEFEHHTYVTTGLESGPVTLATFSGSNTKGVMLCYTLGTDGADGSYLQVGHSYLTPSVTTCVVVREGTGGESFSRYVGSGSVLGQLLGYEETVNTVNLEAEMTLTADDLVGDFSSTVAGVMVEILAIKGGSEVDVTHFETEASSGSFTGCPREPNLIIQSGVLIGTVGGASSSGGATRLYHGVACNNLGVIEQVSQNAQYSSDRARLSETIMTQAGGSSSNPEMDITGFTSNGFTFTGSAHEVMGFAIRTNGNASIRKHLKASSVTTGQTEVMPAAGFSDVGLIYAMSVFSPTLDVPITSTCSVSRGIMTDGAQRTSWTHDAGATQRSRTFDGRIIRGSDNTNDVEGSLDALGPSPTMTWNTASAVDVQLGILYVETLQEPAGDPTEWLPMVI